MNYKNFPRSLTIALAENVYQQVKEIAQYDRVSMAETIRDFIDQAIEATTPNDNHHDPPGAPAAA
jgi:hypothetical protein